MIEKISLKAKIIIFIVAAIIGIGSIAYNTKDNFNFNIVSKNKKTSNNVSKSLGSTVIKSESVNTDSSKVSVEDQEKKALAEQWQKGAVFFNKEENCDECIEIMNEIIAKDPNYYQAYALKGIALCYSKPQGKYTEGMENIDKSLEMKADYGYGRFCKALAYELYGKYDDAIIAYNNALEVEKYVWSYYGLASIYGRKGDVEKAVKNLTIATTMGTPEDNQIVKDDAKKEPDFSNVSDSAEFQAVLK